MHKDLEEFRNKHTLTQDDMAQACGVTLDVYRNKEKGRTKIKHKEQERFKRIMERWDTMKY